MSERYYNDFSKYVDNVVNDSEELLVSQNDFEKLVNHYTEGYVGGEYHNDMERLSYVSPG